MQGAYISIHTLRVEGDCIRPYWSRAALISIHTLRVEGDGYTVEDFVAVIDNFNPHPPRGG